jgi:hypothetical protein
MSGKTTCFYNIDKNIKSEDIDDLCIFWGSHLDKMLHFTPYKISTITETAKLSGIEND